ncbi:MAG: MCE family protein [Desulfobacterales bacterium]|nr:MCE family protein [Desulfobacterales bacterium]
MSKQANKTAIGVFVVGAVAMIIVAIVIFGSGKFFTKTEIYVAYFQGSVKGLRIGAPVVFRGVKVGEVTDILIHANLQDLSIEIPVVFQIEPERFSELAAANRGRRKMVDNLIKRGLRAQLQMQSLVTGQLVINLDFDPDEPVRLLGKVGKDFGKDVLEVPTIQTSMQMLEKTMEEVPLEDLARSIQNSLNGIERIVNSPEITKSLTYLRQTLKDVRNLVRHVDEKIDPLFGDVQQTLKKVQTLVGDVDRQVDPLATSLTQTSDDARKLLNNVNRRVEPIQTDLAKTTANLRAALEAAEETLGSVDEMVSENSEFRYQIDIFLRELSFAARSFRSFADYLERNPDALIRGKTRKEGE